jgi:hypothetical protein
MQTLFMGFGGMEPSTHSVRPLPVSKWQLDIQESQGKVGTRLCVLVTEILTVDV